MSALPRAQRWLEGVLVAVGVYATLLVVAGPVLGQGFDRLGFGAAEAGVGGGEAIRYVWFLQGVLGAVILGWAALLVAVARGPLRRAEPWAASALASSIGLWFVVDTGFSLLAGQPEHALFNVAFLVAVGVPFTLTVLGWRRVS